MSKRRASNDAEKPGADGPESEGPDAGLGSFDVDVKSLIPKAGGKRPEMTAEVRALWKQHFDGDKGARNELVELYFPLAELNAEHMIAVILKAVEEADFSQSAVVGFLEALDAYKADGSGLPFEEYATLKIRAAILEELKGCFEQF